MIFCSILFIKEKEYTYFEFCDFVKVSLRCAFLSACSSKCFTTGTCGLFVVSLHFERVQLNLIYIRGYRPYFIQVRKQMGEEVEVH